MNYYPNGGTAVLVRSFVTSVTLFIFYITFYGVILTGLSPHFDFKLIHELVLDNFKYGAAIFAGCYTLYYTRFASQWSYLANVYNQLMAASLKASEFDKSQNNSLNFWKAAIVEDAINLHLATKPVFAPLIVGLLEEKKVLDCFMASAIDGE